MLSDANLDRYGIAPSRLANILTMNDDVNSYVIFIGSLGDQAHRSGHTMIINNNNNNNCYYYYTESMPRSG